MNINRDSSFNQSLLLAHKMYSFEFFQVFDRYWSLSICYSNSNIFADYDSFWSFTGLDSR